MFSQTVARPAYRAWVRVLSIALFAVATAVSARISVFTSLSPVPLTLQVMVVLLSGLMLGPRDGLVAQVVYLQAILLGAPVAASGLVGPAAFVGPTAGYLVAFPLAALAAGCLSQRLSLRTLGRALGALAGLAAIYLLGTAWLAVYVGNWGQAVQLGVSPFLLADLLKAVVAVGAVSLHRS